MQIQRIQIQRKLPLIIAIICGMLAILLLNMYLQQRENGMLEKLKAIETEARKQISSVKHEAPPPQKMGIALVAKKDIPAQTPISPRDIAIKEIPIDSIHSAAVKSLDEVIGQLAAGPIAAGEQILKTNLSPSANIGKSLSEITPPGQRAVSVLVDDSSNILGLIKTGNFVDVFALLSPPPSGSSPKPQGPSSFGLVPIFQNIKVLAVGTDFGQASAKEGATTYVTKSVTLALSPQEAVLLSFVQEHGKIKLVLRSPEDTKKAFVKPVDWDVLFDYLYPDREGGAKKAGPVVEIYRGLQKEVVPLAEKAK